MKQVLEFLEGKKTYGIAVLIALVAVAEIVGWIDSTVADSMYFLLGAGGIATLRNAIAKQGK